MIAAGLGHLIERLDELTPLDGNPRQGDVEAIAASLSAFGQRKPIVANSDGTILAGNHTALAARSLGWQEIAVVRVNDDPLTAHAYALADNRTAELGDYDDRALAELIGEVHEGDAELFAATGWTGDDLQELLDRLAAADVTSPIAFDELDDDDISTEHECPKCGYVWSGGGG